MTHVEIRDAIKSLQTRKAPGPVGFPNEFYATFCTQLSPILVEVYADSFMAGHLPDTLNQACITLLAKKDRDPLNCASYRPISLLNNDYTILADTGKAAGSSTAINCVSRPDWLCQTETYVF